MNNTIVLEGKKKADVKYVLLFALCFLLFGFFSALLTGDSTLYSELNSPPLSPPPELFAVVWSILYVLIGGVTGSVYSYVGNERNENVKAGLTYAFLGFIVNLLWYPLFFGAGELGAALINIVALIALNIACEIAFFRVKPLYGYLLIPYIIWLFFAFYLNLGYVVLN